MLEGKVLKDFNDKENKLKRYTKGQNFKGVCRNNRMYEK